MEDITFVPNENCNSPRLRHIVIDFEDKCLQPADNDLEYKCLQSEDIYFNINRLDIIYKIRQSVISVLSDLINSVRIVY